MSNGVVHKKTSAGTNLLRELNALLKQRSQVDRKIGNLESRFLKKVSEQVDLPKPINSRKIYVERKENEIPLIEAIATILKSGKKMRTQQICDALLKKGIYDSDSDYLYAMVNNKLSILITDSKSGVKRVGRGIYQIPRKKRSPRKKSNQTT